MAQNNKIIGLISCTKRKHKEPMKASEIYEKSAYFRKQKKFVKQECDSYYILSAKYYLLDPNTVIEPYNKRINDRKAWAKIAYNEIEQEIYGANTFIITAGKDYTEYLVPLLNDANYKVELPTENLKFGPTLSKLGDLIND